MAKKAQADIRVAPNQEDVLARRVPRREKRDYIIDAERRFARGSMAM
jgi:hypothetical protein